MNLMTNFPDQKYLQELIVHLRKKQDQNGEYLEELLMRSGAALNWVSDYVLDPGAQWIRQKLPIDEVILTGTNREWNEIIIDQAERSPYKLRSLIRNNLTVAELFRDLRFDPTPILVRDENGERRVLDGMHRIVAAIRDGHDNIDAFMVRFQGSPKPVCESHVIYDLLRAYERGINRDRDGLISALRFLRGSFTNVEELLRQRFDSSLLRNSDLQAIITVVLQD
ncbi:MAG: hypothetical protein AAB647_01815 [Patescibacteria group bacterium]